MKLGGLEHDARCHLCYAGLSAVAERSGDAEDALQQAIAGLRFSGNPYAGKNRKARGKIMQAKILLLSLLAFVHAALADAPRTFREAKKVASEIYRDHQVTFYCGCDYRKVRGKLRVDLDSCGYRPRKNPRRAKRVEWEHVVPAWWLGHQLQCWQDGGRKNCRRKSAQFRRMEADLHNLVPSVGEVNGDRSNYRYGLIPGPATQYGACPAKTDFKHRRFEPRPEVRGDIARIYRYMQKTYSLKISRQQQRLFAAWDRLDPPDRWEQERWRRIEEEMQR